jgi:hypothetical protein
MGLTAFGLVLAIFMTFSLKRINIKRERQVAEGAPDQTELGDDNPHFRFVAVDLAI